MTIPDDGNSSSTFDPDFASPAEWAAMYRSLLLQVVPAHSPVKGGEWKFPLLPWGEFQNNLVPDAVFDRWYGTGGEHASRHNMGIIAGRCSGNVFVIDLDTYKSHQAAAWWNGILAVHNNGMDPETVEQQTGGGGRQKLFRAPMDWVAPTNKTTIHVDVRGQGGFAMMAPSHHDSGRDYEWLPGRAPWEVPIADAPEWLLEEIEKLVEAHGGSSNGTGKINTPSPGGNFDAFGNLIDDRETYMRDLIWAAVVGLRRDAPVPPSDRDRDVVWSDYERNTRSRLPEDGRTNAERLEEEGRGQSLFINKWRRAARQWDGKVTEAAAKPDPRSVKQVEQVEQEQTRVDTTTGQPLPIILTDTEFLQGYRPPDYLVDGLVQKGYLYSLTGPTGHGKTPISMLMGCKVARGLPYHGRPVTQGGVLFLAGENSDDIRARYIAMADHEGFAIGSIPFYFVDGVIDIAANMPRIMDEAAKVPNLSLVIIDTDQAYFLGDEGNSNEQRKAFAQTLRRILKLPGNPTALVNCHPIKNAGQDNLVPMGGSSFLNEVDGNITCWTEDRTCTIRPHGSKWRGVAFESMSFELKTITCDALVDSKGRQLPSVIAVPITDAGAERRAAVAQDDEDAVLRLMNASKNISMAAIAKNAGFVLPDGTPAKAKVQRITDRLKRAKMIYNYRGSTYRLTKKGCKAIGVKWHSEGGEDDDD